jgi:hypothetical protein
VNAPAAAPPKSFLVVNVILLLWMLMGIVAFVSDVRLTPEQIAASSPAHQQWLNSVPKWLSVVYGIATVSGLLGAIALVMKKALAVPVLGVSLVAVLVQMGYGTFGLDAIGILGASQALPFPVFICVMGGFALWWAVRAKSKGYLG